MPYYRQRTITRMGAPRPRTVQAATMPASVGGVNGLDSLMAMPPEDCIYTFNLMPVEYGLRLRKGYREWAINIGEDPARGTQQVRTILPYESQTQDVAEDRLWAVTDEGIWNVTQYATTAPVQDVTFTQLGQDAGYGVHCEFTNDSERHFLFYADGLNGIHQYEQGVGWSVPLSAGGTGDTSAPPPAGAWYYLNPANPDVTDPTFYLPFPVEDIAFVMVHKLRIWVILENSDDAWYLPLYSIAGELKKFTFGSKLVHGGNLMCLVNWTVDGGDGVDDYLVAVSRGGDVALYRGSDPESADWQTTGTWFIGEVPESRRIYQSIGPDVFLLSTFGLTSLQDLLRGTVADINITSRSAKVNRFLRTDVETGKDLQGWTINHHPADGFLQIVTPEPQNTPFVQYNQNVNTGAWGFWQDVPQICSHTWNGDYFMGGNNGVVWIYDDVLDGTTLADEDLFQDSPAPPAPGPEWTDTGFQQFTCDGTQVADTAYTFNYSAVTVPSVLYIVSYTITGWTAGEHWIGIGFGVTTPRRSGDGTFTFVITSPATPSGECTLNGDADFAGTFVEPSIRQQGALGTPVKFRTLTSFQPPNGNHVTFKRAGFIRTIGILAGTALVNVDAVWDYQVDQFAGLPPTNAPLPDDPLWDSAIWDESRWDFGTQGRSFPQGALGLGRVVAVAIAGSSNTRVNVIGWDFMYTEGGYL